MESIYVVNQKDVVIGNATKEEVVSNALCHRVAAAFIFNSKKKILIHQRAWSKTIMPGLYDMLVGGSVRHKETYNQTVKREIFEEINAKIRPNFLFKFHYTSRHMNYFMGVYIAKFDGKIKAQKDEVIGARFVTTSELESLIKKEKFCPDSVQMWNIYKKKYM